MQGLAERAQDPREGDLRPAIAIMEREVAAAIAHAAGRADEAVADASGGRASRRRSCRRRSDCRRRSSRRRSCSERCCSRSAARREAVPFFEQALRAQSRIDRCRCSGSPAPRPPQDKPTRRAVHYRALLVELRQADADLPALREARPRSNRRRRRRRARPSAHALAIVTAWSWPAPRCCSAEAATRERADPSTSESGCETRAR